MTATLPGQGYIRGFDGIRAIAVAMVITIHLGTFTGPYAGYTYFTDGVAIFFALSGFLITGILLNDEKRRLFRFYGRRMLRLYPALILYIGAVCVAGVSGWASVPGAAAVTGLTYVSNFSPYTAQSRSTGHLWSLAVEEQFYLIWPLVMFWFRRLALPLALATVGVSWYLRAWPPVDATHYVDRYFVPAVDSILMGCIAALIVCPSYQTSERVQRLVSAPETMMVAVAFFLAPKWLVLPPALTAIFIPTTVQRVGVVLGILWICGNQTSTLVNALEWRPLRYLGHISYGIYLWQGLFVRNSPTDPAGWFQRWPYNVICTVVAAVISFELVERRFLRLKNRSATNPGDVEAAADRDAYTGSLLGLTNDGVGSSERDESRDRVPAEVV